MEATRVCGCDALKMDVLHAGVKPSASLSDKRVNAIPKVLTTQFVKRVNELHGGMFFRVSAPKV